MITDAYSGLWYKPPNSFVLKKIFSFPNFTSVKLQFGLDTLSLLKSTVQQIQKRKMLLVLNKKFVSIILYVLKLYYFRRITMKLHGMHCLVRCFGVWPAVSACCCTTACLSCANSCPGCASLDRCFAHTNTCSTRCGTLPKSCGLKR